MQIIYAPHPLEVKGTTSIFLAGSIEMGKAIDWQTQITTFFKEDNITFFNPRRPDWDSGWKEDINNPNFKEQVDWELDALEKSKIIIFFFDPNTKSPISLLELGLFAKSKKLIVCCPYGYWKKGNVDIVCRRNDIQQVNNMNELLTELKKKI